jgi:hypothetical protein
MVIINSGFSLDWKNFNLPKTLYKYRTWNDFNHRKLLLNREVFLADPNSFEDEFDCKIPVRYDLLSDNEFFEKCFTISKLKFPNLSINDHLENVKKIANQDIKKKITKNQNFRFRELNSRLGVLSLTANFQNEDMWKKYGDNFKGFCIGFDPEVIFQFFDGGGSVNYVDELPIISPTPIHDVLTQNILQTYTKLKKWSFEQEYRTYIFDNDPIELKNRQVQLPSEAFKEIILGKKMSKIIENEIIDSIPIELKNISIIKFK